MFEYQKYKRYFAQAAGKLEKLCEEELIELGAKKTKAAYRGVYFNADKKTLYKIIYNTRLCTKIFAPILTFACHSDRYLKKTASQIEWDKLLNLDNTFAISATVSNSKIRHSKYASLCLKDGIADYFNEKYNKRPNVDKHAPDVSFNLHIENNKAIVSINLSGDSLHKRGYRKQACEAPMQETLAAALVRLSRWNGERPLTDIMCGSGTILCEALMHYCNIPAQYLREHFGFFNLSDFDEKLWKSIKKQCDKNIRPLPEGLISGSDKSEETINIARANLKNLPFHESVKLKTTSFQKLPNFEDGTIITNPPYGIRIGTKENVNYIYEALGTYLKKKCKGSRAFVYVGNKEHVKLIGLRPAKKTPLVNGAIQGELVRIDIY